MSKKFPHYTQPGEKDCGPTCIRIISKFYKKNLTLQTLRNYSETTREGSSFLGLSEAAEKIGFKTLGVKINFQTLEKEVPLPCIIHWNKYHFVVVYKITKNTVYVSDPAHGLLEYTKEEFIKNWIGENSSVYTEEGIALLLEPSVNFNKDLSEDQEATKNSFSFIFQYLLRYKNLVVQLIIGLLVGSLLTLILPFLTQSIVDIGIQNQDINFVYLILIAQIMLFIGRMSVEIIRGVSRRFVKK